MKLSHKNQNIEFAPLNEGDYTHHRMTKGPRTQWMKINNR